MSVLIEARKLIADPEHWIQGTYATDETRTVGLHPNDPSAACFCSIGAVVHVLPEGALPEREVMALSAAVLDLDPDWVTAEGVRPNRNIAQYNDSHTHEEVLAVWDHAIAEEARTA